MAKLKTDRRSQRTQRSLHQAMMSLMQEKRYDAITVQDIIDRADVGRSTFYTHYQDKEDLMISGLTRLMDGLSQTLENSANSGERRLLPTRELFEHVRENQHLFKGLAHGRGLELFIEKGQEYWDRKIAADLLARLPEGQQPSVPIQVVAQFVAGTLITMLSWWLENKMPYSPEQMDEMVEKLVTPGVQNCIPHNPNWNE